MLQATFATIQQLLLELGFSMRSDSGNRIRFDHSDSDTWFLFRQHKDDEPVNQPNLVAVRRILDEKGLLSREEFEERLRSRLIAG